MQLDEKTKSLVAVGASIGANCRACLQTNIALALGSGADEQEIQEAIGIGKTVRRCAAEVDDLADDLHLGPSSVKSEPVGCCGSGKNKS